MAAKLNKLDNGSSAPSAPGLDLDEETPSAPSLDTEDDPSPSAPSAPAMIQAFHTPECVVCLEQKVSFKFIFDELVQCQEDNDVWQLIMTLSSPSSLCRMIRG